MIPKTFPRPTILNLLWLGLGSRVVVLLLGSVFALLPLSRAEQAKVSPYAREVDDLPRAPAEWIEAWYRFDARHHLRIAVRGYDVGAHRTLFAFLPLLPLLMRGAASIGLNVHLMGLLIPNAAFAAGLAAFGRAVLVASGDTATTWKACLLLITFPTSFFFSCPYQESLAFLGVSLALLAWLERHPVRSGCALAVATAARQTAVFFGVAVVVEWVRDLALKRKPRHSAWVVALIGATGFLGFVLYGYLRSGDPLLVFSVQHAWGREPMSAKNLVRVLGEVVTRGTVNHLVLVAFVLLGLFTFWREGPLWGTLVLGPVLLAAGTGTVLSMRRIVLGCFPACYPAARALQRPAIFVCVALLQAALQMLFLWHYVHGIWVA